jgi:hypothetical protein
MNGDSDEDEEYKNNEEFMDDLITAFREELNEQGISKVQFCKDFLQVVKKKGLNSLAPPSSRGNNETEAQRAEVLFDDLRNSSFSRELIGTKFKKLTDKKQPIHKIFWAWVYAVAHLPYLLQYHDIKAADMSAAQTGEMKHRQDRVGSMMLTFLYEVPLRHQFTTIPTPPLHHITTILTPYYLLHLAELRHLR